MLGVPRADADALRENQRGVLVQLCDVCPLHHQRNYSERAETSNNVSKCLKEQQHSLHF